MLWLHSLQVLLFQIVSIPYIHVHVCPIHHRLPHSLLYVPHITFLLPIPHKLALALGSGRQRVGSADNSRRVRWTAEEAEDGDESPHGWGQRYSHHLRSGPGGG